MDLEEKRHRLSKKVWLKAWRDACGDHEVMLSNQCNPTYIEDHLWLGSTCFDLYWDYSQPSLLYKLQPSWSTLQDTRYDPNKDYVLDAIDRFKNKYKI